MPSTDKPYYTYDSYDRTVIAEPLIGQQVTLIIDRLRNGDTSTRTGELVSAARLDSGTTQDVLVLRTADAQDQAFSGAIVREIVPSTT